MLEPFAALTELTIRNAPPSIELAPLRAQKKLTRLSLWMANAGSLKDESPVYLPDLAQTKLRSVRTLELMHVGLNDWSALAAFPNAQTVEVMLAGGGEIGGLDLWPKAEAITLSGFGTTFGASTAVSKKLRRLFASMFNLVRIPALENASGVQHLELNHNRIAKLERLDGMTGLESLSLNHNRLTTIENLASLRALTTLDLGSNKIKTIEGLEGLSKLRTLILDGNPLKKFDGLDAVPDGCEVRLLRCGLTKKHSDALTKKHGERLQLAF